jgi:hypothetical protein
MQRLLRLGLFLLGASLLAMLLPMAGRTQPGPGGRKGGPWGKGPPDPGMIFDFMAKGKEAVSVSDIPVSPWDPQARDRMADWLKKKGVTNGQMTRAHFAQYWQDSEPERNEMRAKMREMWGGGKKGPPPGSASPGDTSSPGKTPPADDNNGWGRISG